MKPLNLIASLFLSGVSSLCVAENAFFEECCDENQFRFQPCEDYNLVRLEGGYAVGNFIALNQNYGELGLFIAPKTVFGWQPFVDLRGFLLENRKGAASAGIGLRYFDECSRRISGANLYYDYQNARYGGFQWLGVGVESLGETLDFRLNVHYCLNGFKASGEEIIEFFPDGFIEIFQLAESPVSGVEAEVGYHLFKSPCWSLYGFAGPYYYHTLSDHIYGGYAGLKVDMLKYFTLEGLVSDDHFYGAQVQGKVLINVSLNSLFDLGLSEDTPFKDFLSQPVRRHKMLFIRTWM